LPNFPQIPVFGVGDGRVEPARISEEARITPIDPDPLQDLNRCEARLGFNTPIFDMPDVFSSREAGFKAEEEFTGGQRGTVNGPGDAIRHCVWQCELIRSLESTGSLSSYDRAKQWGDAHECDAVKPGHEDERDMDYHNNEVGRRIGMASRSTSCKKQCHNALESGELITLPRDRWRPRP
jgi:hypothetical protein